MNKQEMIYAAVFSMSMDYINAIMDSCPAWIINSDNNKDFDDWFYSQMGF